jgi:hypothetical protein
MVSAVISASASTTSSQLGAETSRSEVSPDGVVTTSVPKKPLPVG